MKNPLEILFSSENIYIINWDHQSDFRGSLSEPSGSSHTLDIYLTVTVTTEHHSAQKLTQLTVKTQWDTALVLSLSYFHNVLQIKKETQSVSKSQHWGNCVTLMTMTIMPGSMLVGVCWTQLQPRAAPAMSPVWLVSTLFWPPHYGASAPSRPPLCSETEQHSMGSCQTTSHAP